MEKIKTCFTCKTQKTIKEFCKHKDRPDGVTNTCKTCKNTVRRVDYSTWDDVRLAARQVQRSIIDAKQVHKDRRYRHGTEVTRYTKYGITKEIYMDMLDKQDGTCDICNGLNANGRDLSIDHNHDTNEVRGLLCGACNSTLGMSRDSISRLEKCIEYLKRKGNYEF